MAPFSSDNPSGRPVRLCDIAERLNVSTMTVSLAMRAHPSISKMRIEQVRQMAETMGYRPNAMASALAHRKWTHAHRPVAATLAWLNHWENPGNLRNQEVFNLVWRGASAAARALGYHLEEFIWGGEMTGERLEKILLARNIQGIVVPPHPRPPDWAGWDFDKFSVVRIGHSVNNLPVDLISTDQVRSGIEGFTRIWERGYRRIGLVTSDWAERNTLFRAGYLLARSQADKGGPISMLNLRDSAAESFADDVKALGEWMAEAAPDAILTDVRTLRDMLVVCRYPVPDTVGVAMLGATEGVEAGIFQNSEEVGRMSVDTLITLIQRGVRGIPAAHRVHLATPSWIDGPSLPVRTL
ncbi:MAG: LacI family DNA-binding transcriptional regulator [Verrucomicrobia bacterium]|nr:LacI family DNA-binding transcriptional regulator [Verrucomicrobiota bacterium]